MTAQPDPKSLLPLSPPVYHVLLALGEHAMHGYKIMQAFECKMGGTESILPGTLYATISRMKKAGLLEELDEAPADSTDARRRYYRLTEFGRTVASAESERLARLLRIARAENLTTEEVGHVG